MKHNTATETETTVIRPVETIIREKFVMDGTRLTIKPGQCPTHDELAAVLENRVTTGFSAYTQGCYAVHSALQQANGEVLVKNAIADLKKLMPEKTVDALIDDARNTIPFVIAYGEFAKTNKLVEKPMVVSVAKDMRAAFVWNEDKTALLPLADQKPAAKALVKLEKEYGDKPIPQNKIRKARAKFTRKEGGTAKPESAGSTQKATGTPEVKQSVGEKAQSDAQTAIDSLGIAFSTLTTEAVGLHIREDQRQVVVNKLVSFVKVWINGQIFLAGSTKPVQIDTPKE